MTTEEQTKKLLEWLYGYRHSWSGNIDVETMFDVVHEIFGQNIFKELGIDKETVEAKQSEGPK